MSLLHFGWIGTTKKKIKSLDILKIRVIIKRKTMGAQHLTQEEKARLYDDMVLRYQRLEEQVRLIKAKNFEITDEDQRQINIIESNMRKLYTDTQKLF